MTQIEQIKAEIERRMKKNQQDATESGAGAFYEDRELLSFINSLPAEHPSGDLEEETESYLITNRQYAGGDEEDLWGDDCIRDAVKHGANWQKEQMMKNCLYDTEVMLHTKQNNTEYLTLANDKLPHVPVSCGLNVGDKVKILIIKEDEQ